MAVKWRIFLLVCFVVLLVGCQRQTVRETVSDEIVEAFSEDSGLYRINLYIPDEMKERQQSSAMSGKTYLNADGTAGITTGNLRATSAENAILQLCGNSFEEMTVIETKRFGLPEFRFAWYEDKEGGLFRRADVVQDGEVFYYVIFDVKEEAGSDYDQLMAQVFSTFGLSVDEGF